MSSKFIFILLAGAGAVVFFSTRTPEVNAAPKQAPTAVVDQDALKESRKRFYQRAIRDLEQQPRRSPADNKKLHEMRKELYSL